KFRFEWDWKGAEKHLKRAIELNHGYSVARYLYTIYLLALGRFDEAFGEAQMARQLSPVSADVHFSLGLLLYASGQNEQAIEHLRDTVAMDAKFPLPHLVLGLTFGRKGRFDEAIAEFKRALAIAGPRPLWSGYLGQMYALSGRTKEAVEILNDLRAGSKHQYVPPVAFAFVYSGLGKIDDAFHWLEKAVDERDGLLIYLKVGSAFDGLRSDRRFSEVLARVGLQGGPGLAVLHPSPKLPEPGPKLVQQPDRPPPTPSPPWPFPAKLLLGIVAAIVAAIAAYIGIQSIQKPPKLILAIQPFKILGGDPDARRLAEIAREEIFTRLSELHPQRLGVVELTTADSELSLDQVCGRRGPDYVLAGAVRHDGNQMAITDQVVSCQDHTGIVGDRHAINSDGSGIGAAVDDIVRKILAGLPKDIQPAHQVNPKAYEAYLQGRFEWNL